MVDIINLCKTYKAKNHKKTHALKNISLTLPNSGMIFITGKSGSGKSTLLNMISGLDDITSGDILVHGNNLRKFKLNDFSNYRATYIGFIFQDYHIVDEFTVKENIELSADISNIDCDLKDCLKKVDLEGYEDRYPNELSGGQQQRVAIARALAKDAKIILADEPTGNLDNKTTKQILEILKELSKDRLVIIVSHNLDDAFKYGDRIISLENGQISKDISRIDGYNNEFRIEDRKLFLPYNTDLTENNLKQIIDNKNQYDEIIQLNDGMVETKDLKSNDSIEKLNKSKLSKEKFKKLFNLIFKRRIFNKVSTILIISILISLFYVFQSFNAFNENEKIINASVKNNDPAIVIRKAQYKDVYSEVRVLPIQEKDYQSFEKTNYNGNIYKLYNTSINIGRNNMNLMQYNSIYNFISMFYTEQTFGTLNCDEEFLIKLYGKDNKLDVIGDMYNRPYGVVITDYVADSIIYYNKVKYGITYTYDELLNYYPNNYSKHCYINAIVKTDYQEKYKDLLNIYKNLWDQDPSNDNVLEKIQNHKDYEKFVADANKFLGISYALSPNYIESVYESDIILSAGLADVNLSYKNSLKNYSTFNFILASQIKKDYKGNEAALSTTAYNLLFGTNYNKDNIHEFKPHEITVSKKISDADYYEQTFYIKELIVTGALSIYISDENFSNLLKYKYVDYGLYFDSFDNIDSVRKLITKNGFIIVNSEGKSIEMVNRAIRIFGKFLNLISIGFLLLCVIYLIHFGYQSIKSNLYEIGIITALGCDNKDMAKLFIYEILTIGLGIIFISFIGMFIGAISSNFVLVKSFDLVFGYTLKSINIIDFNLNYVIIDLIIALILIVLSALGPLFIIRKIKPVNILKAKE